MTSKYLITDKNGTSRCWWCGSDPLYVAYHDSEWGYPVYDDIRLFEKICLEGFQAGLSWITILKKRENFRAAFSGFEIDQVAKFGKRDVNRLLKDVGIVRHRGKIESTINNAKHALSLIENHGSLAKFFWSYRPAKQKKFDAKRAVTDDSKRLSKDLKKLGWSFVGPTTCYAFMQAMGMVNDHHPGCASFKKAENLRKSMQM